MRVDYGTGLKGEMFNFVHDICEIEAGVSLQQSRFTKWFARQDIFSGPLELNPIMLTFFANRPENFIVSQFELIVDNGDTRLNITRDAEFDLDHDSFSGYVYDQARHIYDRHDHGACIANAPPPPPDGTRLSWVRRPDDEAPAN